MARKIRRAFSISPVPRPPIHWVSYAVTGLLCLALGIGGTYYVMRPGLVQAAQNLTSSAQSARAQADAAEDRGEWTQAIALYSESIASGLDNADIRTDLGVAFFKSNQPQKALQEYVQARKMDPHHENSLFNQAAAYATLGDTPRAIALWKQYLQEFPQGQHVSAARTLIKQVQTHPPFSPNPSPLTSNPAMTP